MGQSAPPMALLMPIGQCTMAIMPMRHRIMKWKSVIGATTNGVCALTIWWQSLTAKIVEGKFAIKKAQVAVWGTLGLPVFYDF